MRAISASLHAMGVPSARLPLEPLRRIKDTVPSVVGFHSKVSDWPAAAWRPPTGFLKGLAFDCADATALSRAAMNDRVKSMLINVVG